MPRFQSTKRLLRRWFTSIPFFAVLGLVMGMAIAVPAIPRPKIAIMNITGALMDQAYADSIVKALREARDDNSIKGVVLQINSPGGITTLVEQVYLDMLQLRQRKPVVASIGLMGASGGYHIAIASNFIYAQASSQIGSIGAVVSLPSPIRLDESVLTTGLFKATGRSERSTIAQLEMVRQGFVSAVVLQRGDRLKLSEEELSLAELYPGIEALRYGLIDEIGTVNIAIEKAASLAGIKNYKVVDLYVAIPFSLALYGFGGFSSLDDLKSQAATAPVYYYLHFESE